MSNLGLFSLMGARVVDISEENQVLSFILDKLDESIDCPMFSYALNCLLFDFGYARIMSSEFVDKIKQADLEITDDQLLQLILTSDVKKVIWLFDLRPELLDRLRENIGDSYPLDLILLNKKYLMARYFVENQIPIKPSTGEILWKVPKSEVEASEALQCLQLSSMYLAWTKADTTEYDIICNSNSEAVNITDDRYSQIPDLIISTKSVELNIYDQAGCTPLINVIKNNALQQHQSFGIDFLKSILKGSDVNLPDASGKTPLDYAFEASNSLIINGLLFFGAQVLESDLERYESIPDLPDSLKDICIKIRDTFKLHEIIISGSIDELKSELDSKKFYWNMLDEEGFSALYHAANYARPYSDESHKIANEMFNSLLVKGIYAKNDLEIKSNQLSFLLVKTKNTVLLSRVFEMGLCPYSINSFGKMLIHEAIEADSIEVVDLLLSKMEITQRDKTDFLCYGASHGSKDMLDFLLDIDGYDANLKQNYLNSTPLIWACIYGKALNIKSLLLKSADINHETCDDLTPLKLLLLNFYENEPRLSDPIGEATQWLLDRGAKVFAIDLKISLRQGNLEIFSLLLNKFSQQEGIEDEIIMLVESFKSIYLRSDTLSDIFMFASVNGHLQTIKFIVENGLETSNFMRYSDSTGTKLISPLYLSSVSGKIDVVRFLLEDMRSFTDTNKETYLWNVTDAFFGTLEKQLKETPDDVFSFENETDEVDLTQGIKSCFCCNNHYEVVNLLWSALTDIPLIEASREDFIRVQRRANAIRIKSRFKVYRYDHETIELNSASFANQVRDRCGKFNSIIDLWFEKLGPRIAAFSEQETKVADKKKFSLERQLEIEKLKRARLEQKRHKASKKKKDKQKLKKQQKVFKLPLGFLVNKFDEIESALSSKYESIQKLINIVDPLLIQIYKDKNRERQLFRAQKNKALKAEYEGKSNGLGEYLSEDGLSSYQNQRAHGLINSLVQSKNIEALRILILLFVKVESGIDCEEILIGVLGYKVSRDILVSFDEVSLDESEESEASESSENLGSKLEYLLHLVGKEQRRERSKSVFAFAMCDNGEEHPGEAGKVSFG